MSNLDVNGYNTTFKAFVDFARISEDLGEKKAIARITEGVDIANGGLAGRTIIASKTDALRGMFHKAFIQYHKGVTQAIKSSNIMLMFNDDIGGEEMTSAKMLVGGLIAARCGAPALQAISDALGSEAASQVGAIYDDIAGASFDQGMMLPHEFTIITQTSRELASELLELMQHIRDAINAEVPETPPFKGDVSEVDDAPDIFENICSVTRKLHADLIETERINLERSKQARGMVQE